VVIFALLSYMGKEKNAKNKTNADPNPTTNPNSKPHKNESFVISRQKA